MKKSILGAALAACAITIAGCDDARRAPPIPPTVTGNLLLLTDNNELASVNVEIPSILISKESIKGLKTGDSLVGLDYRPSDGQLYAIGYLGNIYTIDTTTTTATFEKALTAADTTAPFTVITGDKSQIAVSFDPVSGLLRLVGSNGQNLRIDVETGKTTTDTAINGADATVTSIAHTNSFSETRSTRLFDIDVKQDRLFLQSAPNDGTLGSSAKLGVDASGSSGFAINGINNQGFAVLTVNGIQQLYSIDLSSIGTEINAAKPIGTGKLPPALTNIHSIAFKGNRSITTYGVGLTSDNKLVLIPDLNKPNTVTQVDIKDLSKGEFIVGIDYRNTGILYALSNANKLYVLDPTSGMLYAKKELKAAKDDITQPFTALSGTGFAVDFDPVNNKLRVISNTGQNLRIDVDDDDNAPTTTDDALNGISGAQVSAAAYSNNFSASTTTQLFNLDRTSNSLLLQALPNTGTLTTIGALNIPLGSTTGFDIAGGDNGLALAAVSASGVNGSILYKVNLATGQATLAGSNQENSRIGDNNTPSLLDLAVRVK